MIAFVKSAVNAVFKSNTLCATAEVSSFIAVSLLFKEDTATVLSSVSTPNKRALSSISAKKSLSSINGISLTLIFPSKVLTESSPKYSVALVK